jgi:hypothetical protein
MLERKSAYHLAHYSPSPGGEGRGEGEQFFGEAAD